MKYFPKYALGAFSVLGLAVSGAIAQPAQPSPEELLEQYDQDNNNALSESEFESLYREQMANRQSDPNITATAAFGELDNDGDGELTDYEVQEILVMVAETGAQPSSAQDTPQNAQSNQSQVIRADTSSQSQSQPGQSLEQLARTDPGQLEGKTVMTTEDEEIGELEKVVRHREDGQLYGVISSGGFLGLGSRQSAVPLRDLQMQEDQVVYTTSNAKRELGQHSYQEEEYEELNQQQSGDPQNQPSVAARTPEQEQPEQGNQESLQQDPRSLQEIAQTTPGELAGVKIVDDQGNEIGEVQKTVLKKEDQNFYVVISSDDFLGLGGNDVVLSIEDLEAQSDNTAMLSDMEAAQLFNPSDFLNVEEAD